MQAKGFIKFIIISLIVISIYLLSFTFIKSNIVNKAEKYATTQVASMEEGLERNQEFNIAKNQYLDSIKTEKVFLNLFTYEQVDKQSLNLGLDLKGGISMQVEIDQADVLRKLSNETKDATFNQAIENAIANQASSTKDFITQFGIEYEKIDPNASLASIFAPIEKFRDKIDFQSSNEKVLEVIKKEAAAKNGETHNILKSRIDEFGVAQPFISEPDASGRIYIELPGAENSERIRKIIQTAAVLEFHTATNDLTGQNKGYITARAGNLLFEANEMLVGILGLEEAVEEENIFEDDVVEESAVDTNETDEDELDLGDLGSDLESDLSELEGEDTTTSNAINPLFDLLQPNIYQNETTGATEWANSAIVGYAKKINIPKINSYLEMEEIKSKFDLAGIKLAWASKANTDENGNVGDIYMLYALNKKVELNGDVVTNAFPGYDEKGLPYVSMSMDNKGSGEWATITGKEKGFQVAIVLDDKVFSAPVVNDQITGGRSSISGLENFAEAEDLSNILKSGKLDAKVNIPQEAVVGATLGKAAISSGISALLIGFLLVILFMILYYSKAGIIANIALLVNILFIMGTLASMGAALTLPGLAGIVLTIGMAVDANVIIFERIKEELRKGKGFKLAVKDGFSKSYSAIIDANATTFITAATLLWLGAGPVKGFAIVLMIGIVASFISAVFLSRLIFDGLGDRDKEISLSMSWSENILKDANFDFLGKRKIAYVVSAIIIVAGLASMFTKGFELGVDFKGGRSYVVGFDQAVSTDEIRGQLAEVFETPPTVKTYGDDKTVQIITSYKINDNDPKTDSIVTDVLFNSIKGNYAESPSKEVFFVDYLQKSDKVDTSIADDIQKSALKAGIVGAILIFIYLLIRFRKWQYGVGALGAVLHDTLILLSVFSILWGNWFPFSLEIEQKFIAAILTVIGYSINDTVIVFDRIREYFDEHPGRDIITNVNSAINSTLSRTLMTSFTTILVVLVLFLFGGEAIKGFSFALLIGILVGTYSSVFIASSILVDTMKKKTNHKK